MATRFRYMPSIRKSYTEQGAIFFACQTYKQQSGNVRKKIDKLIEEAGGEYAAALRAYLCTRASWEQVVIQYYVSASTLDRARRQFYELW